MFFAEQCSIIDNSSELPSNFLKKTGKSISAITFTCDDIATLIKSLDPNKAHGHDMISIRMLKICGKSICKPLDLIFQSCIKQGEFPTEWKKANVFPVFKKGDKQILKNYRPVSLLPICGKIFERLIYNNLFEYFIENDLISQNQSGCKPDDSCINQLISTTHFFLIYINDLHDNLISNSKLFVDDASLFSVINDKHLSANKLNQDLNRINNWAFQWKMSFNPGHSKQAQEVIFSRKLQKSTHPTLSLNNNALTQYVTQKHLGMFLDTKLDFQGHLKSIFNKVNKTIGLSRKLHNSLPRLPLLTIYKSFIRPHLDYGNIIYDQAYNVSFHQKLESIQYNSALAITGAIRGTSTEKRYNELGLETLEKRRRYRKLCCFYKVYKIHSPKYLFNIILVTVRKYNTRNSNSIPQFKVKHNFFRDSFFPSAVIEWNKLDLNIRNSESLNVFKNSLLKFIRPFGNSVFNCHNPRGVKLLTRLRLGSSHLRGHKFKHSFQDSLNPICSCGNDIETSAKK